MWLIIYYDHSRFFLFDKSNVTRNVGTQLISYYLCLSFQGTSGPGIWTDQTTGHWPKQFVNVAFQFLTLQTRASEQKCGAGFLKEPYTFVWGAGERKAHRRMMNVKDGRSCGGRAWKSWHNETAQSNALHFAFWHTDSFFPQYIYI